MKKLTWVKARTTCATTALLLPLAVAACTPANPNPATTPSAPDSVYQAAGNAPTWHLTLAHNTLTFKQAGSPESVSTVTTPHTQDTTRVYEAQDLRAEITAKPCTDTLSGQQFSETVRVTMHNQTFKGCGGDPIGPASLYNTKWRVTALNGTPLAAGQHAPNTVIQDMAPTLDINATGKISGSDGCNRYADGLEFSPNGTVKPSAQSGVSTLMACIGPNAAIAQKFNDLKQDVTHWHMQGETLVLTTKDNRTLTLRPVL